ncbi:MAG: hypothetical protein Q4A01_11570 [Coriobacteriales bacterium]|nr:hypothetical protein [Coriobacteriales bacterium]
MIAAALLYVPGCAFFRGLGASRMLSLCCAPLFGVAAYAALPIVYYELGIACSPATVVVPACIVATLVWVVDRMRRSGRAHDNATQAIAPSPQRALVIAGHAVPFDLVAAALFVLVATVVCLACFVTQLPQAGAFAPRHDNITHLNLCRSFLDSGKWSSLHTSTFLASPEQARSIAGDGGFYPAGWNCVVVLVSALAGTDLMVAINAEIALCCAVVFPLGMCAFLRALLPDERRAILLGALVSAGFANWPWQYIHTGPLYPNQLGIALQFGALALALTLLREEGPHVDMARIAVCGLVAFVALSLAHPSTVFSSYVFLACYGAYRIWCLPAPRTRRIAILCVFVCGIVALWALCYSLPMLQSTIGYTEREQSQLIDIIPDLLGMSFTFTGPQVGMVVLTWVGIVCVVHHPRRRWLLGPLAFFALGYVASRADWWLVKHWIAALWYSDLRRMAANLSLYLMPVATLGLDALLPRRASTRPRALRIGGATVAACALMATFVPAIALPVGDLTVASPLSQASQFVSKRYQETIFDAQEIAFVNRVMRTIPQDALVINAPADGSMWAYGICGLNTYYRDYKTTDHTDDAQLIRERLSAWTSDPRIREAVERTGAAYVLLLNRGVVYDQGLEQGIWLWQYTKDQESAWSGITSINDHTPGFSTVLAEGSQLRLYRIG